MVQHLLVGFFATLLQVLSMQPVSAQPTALTVVCAVTAEAGVDEREFGSVICREATDQLASGTGLPIVEAEESSPQPEAPWVRLDVSVVSPQAVRATVEWQTGDGERQSSAEFEAGVDGATLNEDTVRMLVTALLKETPFLAR